MQRFLQDPGLLKDPANTVFRDLVYGWGNEGHSGLGEYLSACIQRADADGGPILECGSGLSTVLIGAVAHRRGRAHWALEHIPKWADRVRDTLRRYEIKGVTVCSAPLKDYGDYAWYAPPLESMPKDFAMVICDGPPGDTKGHRYGLVPVMRSRLSPDAVILLDDAEREEEQSVARRWQTELNAMVTQHGGQKPFIELELSRES